MKDGYVVRQGRTKRVGDGKDPNMEWCMHTILFPLLACGALVASLGNLHTSEAFFRHQQSAFTEMKDKVVELPDVRTSHMVDKQIVHFSGAYNATVTDKDFGLQFDHALKIRRYTEYCQWSESSRDECEKCTRRKDDGSEESYDCNCVRTYYYTKGWRSNRIISLGFDQPANHHNPQRDPFPSASMFSRDAAVDSLLVTHPIVEKLRAVERPATFAPGGRAFKPASMFTRLWHWMVGEPDMRFEDSSLLRQLERSPAYQRDHFVFTNTYEGWFFSAFEENTWWRIARGFGQFLEGSAFDWQIGDLYDMYNGCTAGDIRSRFFLSDPEEVSVVGELSAAEPGAAHAFKVWPHRASNSFDVGIIHEGVHAPGALFQGETEIAHKQAKWARFFGLGAGIAVVYFLIHFNIWRDRIADDWVEPSVLAVGLTCIFTVLLWTAVYGGAAFEGSGGAWTVGTGLVGVGLVFWSPTISGSKTKASAAAKAKVP